MEKPKVDDREHQIVFEPLVDSRTAATSLGIHYKTLERGAEGSGSGYQAWAFVAVQTVDPQRLVQQ